MDNFKIEFNKDFYTKIKNLKGFIKPYFLETHKNILLTVNPNEENKVKCEVNFGRHIVQFIEKVKDITNLTKEYSICLKIEEVEACGKLDSEITFILKNDKPYIYANSIFLPLQEQIEKPMLEDLPYIQTGTFSSETSAMFEKLYKDCCQKENLITLNNGFTYEKITDFLYRLEKNDTEDKFTFSFTDFKILSLFFGKEPIAFVTAPRYFVFKSKDITIHVLKYKLDNLNKSVLSRRQKLTKDQVINIANINTKDLKRVLDTISTLGDKVFALRFASEFCICGTSGIGHKVESETKLNLTTQEFLLDKKELNTIIKNTSSENISVVTGKDFMILDKRFFVLMRSIFNHE